MIVEVSDAELADVLTQLAARAEFHLTTAGIPGRVTATFTVHFVEEALRRLAQDHDLMLLYSADAPGPGSKLLQVGVYAARQTVAPLPYRSDQVQRAALLAEIATLARSASGQRGVPRLVQLLTGGSDPRVRARAAWALGRVAGSSGVPALTRTLADQAPEMRLQALQALRDVQAAGAIQALTGLLLGDLET